MDTIEAIMTRRSTRNFKPDPVSEEDLQILLRAGMQAPSAGDERPWHFIVIDKPEVLHAVPDFHPSAKMLLGAPLAIAVCSDRKLEKHRSSWLQDCAASSENILLTAHAKGLGAVWLGIFPNATRVAGLKSLLDLPDDIRPVSLIAIGHPASDSAPVDRYNEERVHHNRW